MINLPILRKVYAKEKGYKLVLTYSKATRAYYTLTQALMLPTMLLKALNEAYAKG
jgi:outer membrane protein